MVGNDSKNFVFVVIETYVNLKPEPDDWFAVYVLKLAASPALRA